MSELKTLAELSKRWSVGSLAFNEEDGSLTPTDGRSYLFDSRTIIKDLRVAAIEWVRSMERKKAAYNSDTFMIVSLAIQGKIDWIMLFFNLTEEDVRE